MLRITAEGNAATGFCWTLEGRLMGPWVQVLDSAVKKSRPAGAEFCLDLSRLRFADESGLRLLRRLRDDGVMLERASPFLRELLNCHME